MNNHIFLSTDDSGVGGVAQYNHSLACGLIGLGYRVTYLRPQNYKDRLITHQNQLGIQHLWLEADTVKELPRTLITPSSQPNLIVCSNTNPFSNFAIKQIAIQLGIPYIVVEGLVEPHLAERFAQYLDELSHHYTQAKAVIAVSHDNLSLLHNLFRLSKNHGQVIYCGRPAQYFTPTDDSGRDRLRQELNIPSDAVVCFTAARIETRKGYQHQLEAIKQLMHSPVWPQVYFVWAGGGIFEPQLETQLQEAVKQLGITDKVKFLGQLADVSDWLDAADIFVFPSQLEGMPLCVMEAMAKGLPVIASAVSGIPEELGDTGKLLPDPKIDSHATVRELVTAIQDWVINPELRHNLGQAGKRRAEEMFREERMINETVEVIERALLRGDYVSPGFSIIRPDQSFPNMIAGDTRTSGWPYLRRNIPHNWYVDKREPGVGFLSRDEAHIVYNTALKFKGKKALEIGCWLGWSACHLALAGVELDVIDPLLARTEFYESVSSSLRTAGAIDAVNLIAGYSPQKVEELAAQFQRKWSLIFIDGNHEAPGPLNDAIICEQFAEADALILFHDLNSPDVAQGLDYFKQKGWQTMVYQTMQIMGVAWRGKVEPVIHQPDPKINWHLPTHLQHYCVSGSSKDSPVALHQICYTDVKVEQLETHENLSPIILLDSVFFQLFKTGIARVWKSLLQEWAENGFAKRIIVLDRAGTAPKIPGVWYREIPDYDYNNISADRQMLQQVCDEEGADLFMSTYYTTPVSTPSVFVAYDMIPENLGWNPDHPNWRGKHHAIPYASAHIAISENTARDLVRFFPDIPIESVTVAHCGVKSSFTPARLDEVNNFRTKYGISKPYFMLVGTGGYKNTELFLQAFAQLYSKQGFEIVCTGSGSLLADEWRSYTSGSVVHMLQLSDEELRAAYSGAVALVYPSKYEGFGLPVLEAIACGCPVITCPNASIPEVAGEAALYVNDDDVDGLANALCEVQKPAIRKSLIAKGLEQAKKFSWSKMAKTVSSVLIDATLLPLKLKEINLIVFPDWSQPEESLGMELQEVIRAIATHPDKSRMTLLIGTSNNSDEEEVNLLLSSVAMNLMMEEDLDVTDGAEISLVGELGEIQWEALLPRIHGRIVLENEDSGAIARAKAENIPLRELDSIN